MCVCVGGCERWYSREPIKKRTRLRACVCECGAHVRPPFCADNAHNGPPRTQRPHTHTQRHTLHVRRIRIMMARECARQIIRKFCLFISFHAENAHTHTHTVNYIYYSMYTRAHTHTHRHIHICAYECTREPCMHTCTRRSRMLFIWARHA